MCWCLLTHSRFLPYKISVDISDGIYVPMNVGSSSPERRLSRLWMGKAGKQIGVTVVGRTMVLKPSRFLIMLQRKKRVKGPVAIFGLYVSHYDFLVNSKNM